MQKGKLYLIPTLIADTGIGEVLPEKTIQIIHGLDEFIVENERTSRRFIIKTGYSKPIDDLKFHILNKHTNSEEIPSFLNSIRNGKNIGLLSESGVPCIADPGSKVVEIAQRQDIEITPLTGPSSLLLALMASGFNGQNFAFHGYLPVKSPEKENKLRLYESLIYKENQTQIFIEAPYRNIKLFETILKNCKESTKLCVACEISSENQFIKTKPVAEWKKIKTPDIQKRNTVFLLYK